MKNSVDSNLDTTQIKKNPNQETKTSSTSSKTGDGKLIQCLVIIVVLLVLAVIVLLGLWMNCERTTPGIATAISTVYSTRTLTPTISTTSTSIPTGTVETEPPPPHSTTMPNDIVETDSSTPIISPTTTIVDPTPPTTMPNDTVETDSSTPIISPTTTIVDPTPPTTTPNDTIKIDSSTPITTRTSITMPTLTDAPRAPYETGDISPAKVVIEINRNAEDEKAEYVWGEGIAPNGCRKLRKNTTGQSIEIPNNDFYVLTIIQGSLEKIVGDGMVLDTTDKDKLLRTNTLAFWKHDDISGTLTLLKYDPDKKTAGDACQWNAESNSVWLWETEFTYDIITITISTKASPADVKGDPDWDWPPLD